MNRCYDLDLVMPSERVDLDRRNSKPHFQATGLCRQDQHVAS